MTHPQGLVVPVIRNADTMSFLQVEQTIAELGNKARDSSLSIEEMTGGTFTISNGGTIEVSFSLPVVISL